MSDIKLYASEPSCSEEDNFLIFCLYIYGSNPGSPRVGHSGPGSHYLNKLCKGLLAKATYQISST